MSNCSLKPRSSDFRIKLTIAKLNLPQEEEEEQEMCQTNFLAVSQASLLLKISRYLAVLKSKINVKVRLKQRGLT